MAKVTNSFVTGKMNKDLDDRLLKANEYRNAMNAQVSRSEGANVGALENVLGNSVASDFRALTSVTDFVSIGYCVDEVNSRVFVFLTNNKSSTLDYPAAAKNNIIVYNALNDTATVLVVGRFLNFSTAFPITGVNILENLLYFTDNRNQPRVINVDLANPGSQPSVNPNYYTIEDQISVAKYNPYQSIQLYKESSIANKYETTMYDVVSEFYPNGGLGALNANAASGAQTFQVLKAGFIGDIVNSQGGAGGIAGVTVAKKNKATGVITDTGLTVNYSSTTSTAATFWTIGLSGNLTFALDSATEEIVFSFNPYYNADYNGDKDYLRDRFVRFAYRYKFIDGQYSIMSPFTQECFIPKQDGYFMYKLNQLNALDNYTVDGSPPLDIEDEADTYRSTVVGFMENKVNKIILRIPLPYTSADMQSVLKVEEIDILYKESESNIINIIESVSIDRVQAKTATNLYEYEYQSTKPYKVLPSSETTRTYDKVPVRALSQEVISNRIVYGNFIDKHNPPSTIDYNVAVSPKSTFNLGSGTTTPSSQAASGATAIDINTVVGVIQNGYLVTSNVAGAIPTGTVVANFVSTGVKLSAATAEIIPLGSIITFTSPNAVAYTTSEIEYPNSSLKQNRNYQVGIVLSDKFGRSSTVILSETDSSTSFNNEQYLGSTVFSSYLSNQVDANTFPGNSLKLLFNSPISGSSTGIYNGDKDSLDYNPLGWYSYKVVVKQQEQEYYNVYLPGIMASYPQDPTKELGKTSHCVLIGDNINKVPRDLSLVGPEQKQFRSSITLHGRVENLPSLVVNLNNTQYYPGNIPPVVSVIGTDTSLFDGVATSNYVASSEFYNVISNPLIARLNTPSKKIGVAAVITTAVVDVSQTGAGALDEINITISSVQPQFPAGGNPAVTNSIFIGQIVSGNGVPPGTTVTGSVGNSGVWKLTFSNNLEGTTTDDILTFSPTNPLPSLGFITMPQLAVMETDGVDSELDIFWETTSEGLITQLNQAILGGTTDGVALSGFNASTFTEALAVNSEILSADFNIVDQFGNNIVYDGTQTPPQLQLTGVVDVAGNDVSSTFSLVDDLDGTYNVKLNSYLFYSTQNATLQTYAFTFVVNYSSASGEPIIESTITRQPVALLNIVPSIFATPSTVTYVVGTSGTQGGVQTGFIEDVQGQNGAISIGTNPSPDVAWRDLAWSLSVIKDGVQYASGGSNQVTFTQSKVNAFWAIKLFFAGGDPPNSMVDGTYAIVATLTDAGGLSATSSFSLIIERDPCYTYKFTYQNTGNTISGNYTDCGGGTANTTFTDTDPGSLNGATYVCARDTSITQAGLVGSAGFVQLALNNPDLNNNCNG